MEGTTVDRGMRRIAWPIAIFFVASMVAFSVLRLTTDSATVGSIDTNPKFEFDIRYLDHPILTYGHIVPGVVFLLLGLLQLSKRVRRRSLALHRAIGKVAMASALLSAVFGILFGLFVPFGGVLEQSASLVFGMYLAVAVGQGLRAARSHDQVTHRRWMIRAFAVAIGVATIRVILSLGEELDLLTFDDDFGAAFWGGFLVNAVIAEAWLRKWPRQPRRTSSLTADA